MSCRQFFVLLLLFACVGLSATIITAKDTLANVYIPEGYISPAEEKVGTDKLLKASELLDRQQSKTSGIDGHAAQLDFKKILLRCQTLDMQEKVYGLVKAYYPKYISRLEWKDEDVVFTVRGQEIWYAGGRLLSNDSQPQAEEYRSILYPYSTDSIYDMFEQLPKPREDFSDSYVRSSDFQIALTGGSPSEIEPEIHTFRVLGFRVRLHSLAGEAAQNASKEVMALAKDDSELAGFIDGLKTISGYVNRKVSKSSNISMHGFGFAMDLIPYKYYDKVSYWQWAKVWYPEDWGSIPLERRWLIDQRVIRVFEKHGFVWGGKWPNYDTMHLEYRPELIGYAEARKITGSLGEWHDESESTGSDSILSTNEETGARVDEKIGTNKNSNPNNRAKSGANARDQ